MTRRQLHNAHAKGNLYGPTRRYVDHHYLRVDILTPLMDNTRMHTSRFLHADLSCSGPARHEDGRGGRGGGGRC